MLPFRRCCHTSSVCTHTYLHAPTLGTISLQVGQQQPTRHLPSWTYWIDSFSSLFLNITCTFKLGLYSTSPWNCERGSSCVPEQTATYLSLDSSHPSLWEKECWPKGHRCRVQCAVWQVGMCMISYTEPSDNIHCQGQPWEFTPTINSLQVMTVAFLLILCWVQSQHQHWISLACNCGHASLCSHLHTFPIKQPRISYSNGSVMLSTITGNSWRAVQYYMDTPRLTVLRLDDPFTFFSSSCVQSYSVSQDTWTH